MSLATVTSQQGETFDENGGVGKVGVFYVNIFCAYFSRTNVTSLLVEETFYLLPFLFQRKKLGYFNYFLKIPQKSFLEHFSESPS